MNGIGDITEQLAMLSFITFTQNCRTAVKQRVRRGENSRILQTLQLRRKREFLRVLQTRYATDRLLGLISKRMVMMSMMIIIMIT
jgi:hypothetical protein